MKIIIAPAKKMVVDQDSFDVADHPQYLAEAQRILAVMQTLTYEQAKTMWHASDKLAQPAFELLQHTDLTRQLTPALIAYSGIQYQYMAPGVFTAPALAYVQENLRILSGFYGILRPFDGIVPYRLEMQSAIQIDHSTNLYDFWGAKLYTALHFDQGPVVNLASKEYAAAITPYMQADDQLITVKFGSLIDGQLKTRATHAKMARGEMVRYMAENNVTTVDQLRAFHHAHFQFDPTRSTATTLSFVEPAAPYHQR